MGRLAAIFLVATFCLFSLVLPIWPRAFSAVGAQSQNRFQESFQVRVPGRDSAEEPEVAESAPFSESSPSARGFSQRLQALRQERREGLQQLRLEAQERLRAQRQEFTEKLTEIRDEHRRGLLERIDQRLVLINTNRVNHFNRVLTRLETILEKIETLIGDNPSPVVSEALVQAQESLALAQYTVETQAAQDYVIVITEESALKESAATVVVSFKNDLQSAAQVLNEAKKAVLALWSTYQAVSSET